MAKIDLGRVVGADGKSAYQIAVEHGFEGSEQEWLDSLNYDDDISALDEKINQEIEDRTNADTEIQNTIESTVNNAIAEIVANSPEDLDTLKEIADWIETHEDSASAMNTAILENKNAIAKKADASHTHDDRYYTETEIDTKLNSPLPWGFNYLSNGYSADLQYRRIGEGYFTYSDNMNWSFYSEIEMIHHNVNGVFERGVILIYLRGRDSSINDKKVVLHSLNGRIANLTKTKINYKIDTENKRISLEILAYCYTNYTNILFRNSLTRIADMLFTATNFWTFTANKTYTQSSTTMQADVTNGYTEIPLSVVSIDKNGNDIVNTYATKTELSEKADISHTHDDRYYTETEIDSKLNNKVDKVSGKGLSTNDYTTAEKNKLAGLSNYDDTSLKTLINGKADSSHTHDDRYYTESEVDTKLNEKLNKNAPSVSIKHYAVKNTESSYKNMWTKIASCKFTHQYNIASLSLEITQSGISNNANSFWKGVVHLYTQNKLPNTPAYSFICTEKTGYLAEDCIKILIYKLTDENGNTYLQCEMYLKSPNSTWITGYYTPLFNISWTLFENQDYVSELPSADVVITPTFISKASHDKDGNDIVNTYATKAELNSHTHDELAVTSLPSGTDLNSVNLMAYDCKEFYSVAGGTYSNAPSNSFTLRLIETENGGCVQLFCSHKNSAVKLYSRAQLRVNDSYLWTEWSSLANIDEINTKLNAYATKAELSGKADSSHTHDDRYYTEAEIDTKLSTYALKSDLANAGMSVSAKNVMEATGSIDFNTNKALFQLPIYSAEDTDQPTALGAMWIQEIKEDEE